MTHKYAIENIQNKNNSLHVWKLPTGYSSDRGNSSTSFANAGKLNHFLSKFRMVTRTIFRKIHPALMIGLDEVSRNLENSGPNFE